MAGKDIALGVVIGGVVSATFGRALNVVGKSIDDLKQKGDKAKIWQNVISETMRLQKEFRAAHLAGSAAADGIRTKIEKNQDALKAAGFAVDKLADNYTRLGRIVRGIDLQLKGRESIKAGKEQLVESMRIGAVSAVPVKVAADFQAIIRDIAIKGGFANTAQERDVATGVRTSADKNGISRDELASAINQLVSGGMDAKEAINYADVIAKFSIGQGSTPEETAKMIRAISQNAQIKDAAGMNKALEAIAYLGQAGNFESPDMAKAFPGLLAEMQKLGIVGQESVTQLGAMLQVQMKVTGSADEAANNLKNWMSKIGSEDTKKNYEKAGIDYEQSMKTNIAQGWSTLEASLAIAKDYVERIDPKKAEELKKFAASMDQVSDPAKRQAQIAAFEEVMKTGDLFSDMQVKAALTAYMQNSDLYAKLKREAAESNGLLEKNLNERRETSKRKWAEVGNAINDALETVGDALRPVTDRVADAVAGVTRFSTGLAKMNPTVTTTVATVAAAFLGLRTLGAAWKIGKGAFDIARGTIMARGAGKLGGLASILTGKAGEVAGKAADVLGGAGVQRVFVVNMPGSGFGGGLDLPSGADGGKPGTKPSPGKPQGRWAAMKAGATGLLGKAAPYAGKIGGGLAVAGAVYSAVDTFRNAKTDQEKAEGYGGAAGGLAGGLAGAKAGAVFGALAGPVGIAIGGIAGGVLGSILGDKAGSWLGGKIAEPKLAAPALSAPKLAVEKLAAPAEKPAAPAEKLAAPALSAPKLAVEKPAAAPQQLTFSPTIQVTVQGDVKDPRQLANELMPHLRRMFEQFQSQSARGAMFDPAHA